jgi:parallel beta-helix repeat protein
MKRRIKKTAISLIVFLALGLTIFTSANAVQITSDSNENFTIIVDKNGEGDYTTIQDAVNNAQDGFTVFVKRGEYVEIIDIKKRINLVGEDKDSTLISPISEKNKYAIRLGAPGATISRLSIKNGAPGLYASGIRVTSSGTEIRDCNIYDTPIGIVIWTSNNIVDNCNFWGCTDEGIALIGTEYSDCSNNEITNCIFRENCDGIELQYSSNNIISNCDFHDNTHTGIDGIASSNNENTIIDCRIYNNEVHGIYFHSSSENQIKDCFIYDNEDGNIVFNDCSEDNQITSNFESNSKENRLTIRDLFHYFLSRRSRLNLRGLISILRSLRAF